MFFFFLILFQYIIIILLPAFRNSGMATVRHIIHYTPGSRHNGGRRDWSANHGIPADNEPINIGDEKRKSDSAFTQFWNGLRHDRPHHVKQRPDARFNCTAPDSRFRPGQLLVSVSGPGEKSAKKSLFSRILRTFHLYLVRPTDSGSRRIANPCKYSRCWKKSANKRHIIPDTEWLNNATRVIQARIAPSQYF